MKRFLFQAAKRLAIPGLAMALMWLALVWKARNEAVAAREHVDDALKAVAGLTPNDSRKPYAVQEWAKAVGRYQQANRQLAQLTWPTYVLRIYAPCPVADYESEPVEAPSEFVLPPKEEPTRRFHVVRAAVERAETPHPQPLSPKERGE